MTAFNWSATDDTQLLCKKKWFETPDSVSLILVTNDKKQRDSLFEFYSGQFVTIGIEILGKMEYRAYSISSIPNQNEMQLTIKRVAGGKVSNYIIDQLEVGDLISVLPPAGEFHLGKPYKNKVLLLSAGCGISPVMSMAKTLLADPQNETDIHFIHAAADITQVIYLQELLVFAQQHDRFHLHIILKHTNQTYPEHLSATEIATLNNLEPKSSVGEQFKDRLCKESLLHYCPDITKRSVFLCGPIVFMETMKNAVKELGLNMAFFYQESFTPAESTQPNIDASITNKEAAITTVSVPTFNTHIPVQTGSLLIDALESKKLPVIAACRSGICGSCKCKVTDGKYTRTSTATLTSEELNTGVVLACSCNIESNLIVELN